MFYLFIYSCGNGCTPRGPGGLGEVPVGLIQVKLQQLVGADVCKRTRTDRAPTDKGNSPY